MAFLNIPSILLYIYIYDYRCIPSGKRLHNYGKSPLLIGKSIIMVIENAIKTIFNR